MLLQIASYQHVSAVLRQGRQWDVLYTRQEQMAGPNNTSRLITYNAVTSTSDVSDVSDARSDQTTAPYTAACK